MIDSERKKSFYVNFEDLRLIGVIFSDFMEMFRVYYFFLNYFKGIKFIFLFDEV